MNYIEQMFDLQRQLNDHTNGVMWVDGITKENRKISWYRCIYMEAAEAIDSFNWKHWKSINTVPDWANIKVELVDIWHFIMSESIRMKDERYANKYLKLKPQGGFNSEVLINTLEKMLKLSVNSNIDSKINNIRDITDLFFTAISQIDMDIEELYKLYVVKNQLNIFRQQHGYKDGSYIKFWNTVEDNVVAFNIMDENPSISPNGLYQKLESEYSQIG